MRESVRPTILDEIVAWNRHELAKRVARAPLRELADRIARVDPPRDFAGALRPSAAPSFPAGNMAGGSGPRLIAEIKRASPSKGPLAPDLDPAGLAAAYELGGAAALSVLTEPRFFRGGPGDLAAARAATTLPVLRKDFLFDPYQLFEARALAADAVLLIVAILDGGLLAEMLDVARVLGLAALVEVHDEAEVERAVAAGARIVGINNRDLRTFRVDLETTRRLRGRIPAGRLVVSESGIHSQADVTRLREWDVDAMLVGESLVRAGDVAAQLRELLL